MSFNTNLPIETIDKIAKTITSKTITSDAHKEINFFFHHQIHEFLKIAILYCEFFDQDVINEYCILKAFPERCYFSFLSKGYKTYRKQLIKIEEIQDEKLKRRSLKNMDKTYALYIDVDFFQMAVILLSKKIKPELKFTRESLIYLQFYVEYDIKLLIGYSNILNFYQSNVINASEIKITETNFERRYQMEEALDEDHEDASIDEEEIKQQDEVHENQIDFIKNKETAIEIANLIDLLMEEKLKDYVKKT